jgi:predicted HicB family RNase H-like nuclease
MGQMINIMDIDGYKAVISYDPEEEMFRGEFFALNGGADFYAKDIDNLQREGRISLKTFLVLCKGKGVDPVKKFSGKFNVRLHPELHRKAVAIAIAKGKSLNQFVAGALEHELLAEG